jgi:hypothetical protein
MTTRPTSRRDTRADGAAEPEAIATPPGRRRARKPGLEPAPPAPRSRDEAEAQYVSARDAWTGAMRAASSGRSADLALLAIAQETYERAYAEREAWLSGARVAIRIEDAEPRRGLDVFVAQDLAWRRVHEAAQKAPGRLERLVRRLTRRG